MYESFFGLNRRPFCFAPAVDRYFPVANSDAARQALARCIDRAEGVGLLVGAPGLGKSLIVEVLADQFRDRFPVVRLGTGQIETRRELLQALAHDLRVPFRGMDDGELRLAVTSFLTSEDRCPQGILILADEAHTFSFSILDELRMLTNVVADGEPRVRVVLTGNMRLEEQLTDPRLESLSQRIVCRRYLEKFDSSEAAEYIRFQIAAAGGQVEKVFEPAACEAVYQASDGIPRLINQLCDYALLTAYSDDQQPITAQGISAAWAELQQLPGQWVDPPGPPQLRVSGSDDDDVIEYGGLSDDDVTAEDDSFDDGVHIEPATMRPSLLRVDDDEEGLSAADAEFVLSSHADSDDFEDAESSIDTEIPIPTDDRALQDFTQIESQLSEVIEDHVTRQDVAPAASTDHAEVSVAISEKGNVDDETLEDESSPNAEQEDVQEPVSNDTSESKPTPRFHSLASAEFEEEEVVVDRFARLEDDARKHVPPAALPVSAKEPENGDETVVPQPALAAIEPAPAPEAIEPVSEATEDEPAHSELQIEEDEDRLQVFVDPYGDLYDDDDTLDDLQDIPSGPVAEQQTEPVSSATQHDDAEHDDAGDNVVAGEIEETIKLPPQARPAYELQSSRDVSEDDTSEDDADQMIRPIREATSKPNVPEAQPATSQSQASRPILIIEDDEEHEFEETPGHTLASPEHDVRLEDYNTLFARLRGAQDTNG